MTCRLQATSPYLNRRVRSLEEYRRERGLALIKPLPDPNPQSIRLIASLYILTILIAGSVGWWLAGEIMQSIDRTVQIQAARR